MIGINLFYITRFHFFRINLRLLVVLLTSLCAMATQAQQIEMVKNIMAIEETDSAEGRIGHSRPDHFTEFNGLVAFIANVPESYRQIWFTDGTKEGTQLAYGPGKTSWTHVSELSVLNSYLFFVARDESDVYVLWISDGTVEGTRKVEHDAGGASPSILRSFGDLLLFTVDTRLWAYNTLNHTAYELSSDRDGLAYNPLEFKPFQNRLVFAAQSSSNANSGFDMWVTDGTTAGTYRIMRINGVPWGMQYAEHNAQLYFVMTIDGRLGHLYKFDAQETRANRLLTSPYWTFTPSNLTAFKHGVVFWRDYVLTIVSDGQIVQQLTPNDLMFQQWDVSGMIPVGDYFMLHYRNNFLKYNGTNFATIPMDAEISLPYQPGFLTLYYEEGNKKIFKLNNHVFSTDGDQVSSIMIHNGTSYLSEPIRKNNSLWFNVHSSRYRQWVSLDLTTNQTESYKYSGGGVAQYGQSSGYIPPAVFLGDVLIYAGYDENLGTEPFRLFFYQEEDCDLVMYPNPTAENLYLADNFCEQSQSVQVYSSAGQLLIDTEWGAYGEIDITTLQPGIYIVKSGDQAKKIIKY